MKSSNKKLLTGLILLIVTGTIIYAISSNREYELENQISFSLHNNDEIEHQALVEIFDSTNTSVLKEIYIVAPGDKISPGSLKMEDGTYRIEVTLDNDTNKKYIGNQSSGQHDYIYITGNPDEPFMVEIAYT